MNLEEIPPTELFKFLNQVDLCVLKLVNKRFNSMYSSLCDKIKQFSETRANYLFMQFRICAEESKDVQIDYSINSSVEKYINLHSEKLYHRKMDFSMITDLIHLIQFPVKLGDVIRFKDACAGVMTLFVIRKEDAPEFQQFDIYQLFDNLYLCHCIGLIPFQCISPYHWTNYSIVNDILLPFNYVYFYYNEDNTVKYVEIDFKKFRFRLDCSDTFVFLTSPKYIAIRVVTYSGNGDSKRFRVDQIYSY